MPTSENMLLLCVALGSAMVMREFAERAVDGIEDPFDVVAEGAAVEQRQQRDVRVVSCGADCGLQQRRLTYDGDAYRAVYAVRFASAVYVVHAFKKKSKTGIKTPQADIDLIKARLKDAEADHKERLKSETNP
jgi:phage-related protein